jgi:hypothetical protein
MTGEKRRDPVQPGAPAVAARGTAGGKMFSAMMGVRVLRGAVRVMPCGLKKI